MAVGQRVEMVPPTQIVEGDVIEDPVGNRWLRVGEIRIVSEVDDGAFSFYADSPDDRVTFEGTDLVKRMVTGR